MHNVSVSQSHQDISVDGIIVDDMLNILTF